MTEDDAQDVLEKIMELAALLGWGAVLARNKDGDILGMYFGSPQWIDYKEGRDQNKPAH